MMKNGDDEDDDFYKLNKTWDLIKYRSSHHFHKVKINKEPK